MSDADDINWEDLSDAGDIPIEELLEDIETTSFRPDFLDDFHFRELVDLRNYLIHQEHMVNDMSFKLNNKKGKLIKKVKKGTVYDMV